MHAQKKNTPKCVAVKDASIIIILNFFKIKPLALFRARVKLVRFYPDMIANKMC